MSWLLGSQAASGAQKSVLWMGVSSFGYSGTNGHAIMQCRAAWDPGSMAASQAMARYQQRTIGWQLEVWDKKAASLLGTTQALAMDSITSPITEAAWERSWQAATCSYTAKRQSRLSLHKRIHHSENTNHDFPCAPGCSFVATQQGSLKTHKRTQHSENGGSANEQSTLK